MCLAGVATRLNTTCAVHTQDCESLMLSSGQYEASRCYDWNLLTVLRVQYI